MTRRISLVVLGLLVAMLATQAAGPPVPDDPSARAIDQRILHDIKQNSQIMTNLTYLSDVIGHRLTGSASLEKANNWTAEKMKTYGLTNVRLEPWTIPEGWQRGKAHARLVAPGIGRDISIAAAGWSPGTKGKIEGEVVFLKAQNKTELDAYKGKLKNAIILLATPRPVERMDQILAKNEGGRKGFGGGGKGDFTKGRNMTEMQTFRRDLNAFLTKEGAAAIFQSANKPLGLLVTTGSWGGRGMGGGGGGGERPSAEARMPTFYVAHNHYELLYRLATLPGAERPKLELDVENKFLPGPVKVYNTVGEIQGSEKPDEFVVVGAHLDSWDLGNGTTDNGTGSCIVLETARVLANSGVKPKRTIRFVLFTGEEQGLHGSRVYTEKHKDEMERTSAALVHDTGTGRVRGVGAGAWPAHRAILERELISLKELGVTDFNARSSGGSDHASFSRIGVPGLMLVQDMTTYTYTHHTQADTLDAVNAPNLIQGAQTMAVTAMRIANLKELLPRVPTGGGRRFGGE